MLALAPLRSLGPHSLFTPENSLFRFQKLPVPLPREFGPNRLNLLDDHKQKSLLTSEIFQNSLLFSLLSGKFG